jgi:hypothetical protein|tara:strand:- start:592 stop:831 length:240 start_codon:yes stop_codon:yes gene_type:complete
MNQNDVQLSEVLFEFSSQGNYVKVVAVDPITNTEISMVGDVKVGRKALEQTAIQKLRYVIAKNRRKMQAGNSPQDDDLC